MYTEASSSIIGVAFTKDGNAVMRTHHHSVVLKRELSRKTKHSVVMSMFVPILTYGYESLVMAEKECDHKRKRTIFLRKIKEVKLLTNFVTLRFEKLSPSCCYFSGSKDSG